MRRGIVVILTSSLVATGCGDGQAGIQREHRPPLRGAASLGQRFGDVAQRGPFLGSPRAPYTLVEFVDLQCPFCARFDRDVLPLVIERFVRPGRLRLQLRPVAFIGRDSATGAAATVAAGMQDRMWQFADLFYRNQGRENSGYVTPAFLGRIARAVPGLDPARFQRVSGSRTLVAMLEDNARAAHASGITGTPSFRLGRSGDVLAPFGHRSNEPSDFAHRIQEAIGPGGRYRASASR
jgi:predicted DsbA family dithiol-disulfide isomerase